MDVGGLLLAAEVAVVDKIDLNQDGIPGQLILGIALGLYMLALFGLSVFASKNIENEEDFLVAGRRLGLFLCWGSLIATWFGAASMTGAAQSAREEGLVGTVLDPWACSATLIIAGLFYAPKLWRMKLYTTGDFFRRVYGTRAELTCSSIQIPSYFGWIATQYMALASVQQAYFGVPENVGIFIGFFIALVYTMVGGMWSVTLTDTVQIVIAFAGLLILAFVSFASFGNGIFSDGWARFYAEYTGPHADAFTLLPAADATLAVVLGWFGVWATGLFGNLPGQDLQQRMFSAKSAETARNACILSGVMYLMFGLIPVTLGLMSRLELPLETTFVEVKVLMYMAAKNLNVPLAIIFVVSFVSIVMSTACSAVLAPATILGHNFLSRIKAFQHNRLRLERICVLLISLGGLSLAYWGKSVFSLLDLALSLQLVGLFVPLTMGLYGKPRGELPAILAAVLGIVFFAARYAPEEVIYTLPDAFAARSTLQDRFLERKPQLSGLQAAYDSARDDDTRQQARHALQARSKELMDTAIVEARQDMEQALAKYVPREQAAQLVTEKFDGGLDWVEYMKLRMPRERVGSGLYDLVFGLVTVPKPLTLWMVDKPEDRVIGLVTISADLYGLVASIFGYFLGQWILKRRGCQWRPGALEPPGPTAEPAH